MSLSNTISYDTVPFSHWFALNKPELEAKFKEGYGDAKDTSQECEECGGNGSVECDLGQDHDCMECEGSGQVEVTYEESFSAYAYDQYSAQVAQDRQKVKKYADS